jgi:drug/metabolite transporter (DMT)-like permease
MIFIFLSVIQSTLIFILFKLFERYRIDNWQAILVNYVVATAMSFFLGDVSGNFSNVVGSEWVRYAILLGFMFIATFYFFALSSQKAGVAITSVTSKMSVIIPVLFGAALYGESFGIVKISGVVVALTAFYLVFKKEKKPLLEMKWAYLPLMVFLGNGFVDTGMKYLQHHYIGNDLVPFLMFTFASAMVIALIINISRIRRARSFLNLRSMIGGSILGIANFGSTYYIIKALSLYESSVVFPVANSAIVGLSALTGYFWFRERLTLVNWIGVLLAITAIIIIANA